MIQALQTIADNIQATSQPGWVECLSIVISSISVVVSGIAIWFAIRVPKQIAEQQNKIALFEKRVKCHDAIQQVIDFSKFLQKMQDKYEDIRMGYTIYFGMEEAAVHGNLVSCQPLYKLFEIETTLTGGKYLFLKIDSELIDQIVILLRKIYLDSLLENVEDTISQRTREDMTEFHSLCQKLESCMSIIEEQYLQLS